MEQRTPMTAGQARKLMELASIAGKPCNVKSIDKDLRHAPGRAILKGLQGETKAIIQPFHHRKEEIVDLSTVAFWKGGCAFDISPAEQFIEAKTDAPVAAIRPEFVVLSEKNGGLWSNKGWTKYLSMASRYIEHSHAARAVGKINKVAGHEDAKVASIEEGQAFVTQFVSDNRTSIELPVQVSKPEVKPMTTTPINPELLKMARPQPSIPAPVIRDDDDFIDSNALRNEDDAALRLAEEERKKLLVDFVSTRNLFNDIRAKLTQLDNRVMELGGKTILKQKSDNPSQKKRVVLRSHVRPILLAHSRLSSEAIHERLVSEFPTLELKKVKQCLFAMSADGLVEKNDSGGWAITAQGREARMMGEE